MKLANARLIALVPMVALFGFATACSGQANGSGPAQDQAFVSSEPAQGMTEADFNDSFLQELKTSLDQSNLSAINRLEDKQGLNRSSLKDASSSSTAIFYYGPKKLIFYNSKIGSGMQLSVVIGIVDNSIFRVVCPDFDVKRQTVLYGECNEKITQTFGFSLNPSVR